MEWNAKWIWSGEGLPSRNAFVRFRRGFRYSGGPAILNITADSRYVAYVNGIYLGQGPVRAWPNHWRYDTYDIEPYLTEGGNIVAVLVNHFGEGNFQYIHGPAGLLAQVELDGEMIGTDPAWKCSEDPAFISAVPRISVQEAFEEQYDARKADAWTSPDYDDSTWSDSAVLDDTEANFHKGLEPRGIPFLTMEAFLPQRIVSAETVRSLAHHFTIYAKPYLAPGDLSSNHVVSHAYLATQIWSPAECEISVAIPHKYSGRIKLNGNRPEGSRAKLKSGWNSFAASIRGDYHLSEYSFSIDGPADLIFNAFGDTSRDGGWALVGPFDINEAERSAVERHMDESVIVAERLVPDADCAAGEAFWQSADTASVTGKAYFQPIRPEHLPASDAFLQAYTDRSISTEARIGDPENLLSGMGWTTIYPDSEGGDVRLLVDFGREIVGFHRFDITAPAGTTLDIHNFEFIQPDGRYNMAEGMNNSCRYICREGCQSYQTYVRRGFRYTYLILRNMTGPVRLGRVAAIFNSYPQSRRGHFASSDSKLDRIWQVGADTLRSCAEDTYTDCPTYEQTHWVGDARNEALIDWVINGDPRLWFRCLEQTGQSLERSSITESHVPSAWVNILPAWSCLWMRSCREYMLYTGDRDNSRRLLSYIQDNVEGLKKHLNDEGLLSIRGWNMFDWADMDTPSVGVVTHINCLAVQALNESAELAGWLAEGRLADSWRNLAASISTAVNAYLWNDGKAAYTDCLRGDAQSPVFSQQTQTVAVMSGVAKGDRAERCQSIIHNPPEDFVKAGSPFFEFFLLEAYQQEGRVQEFIDTIRSDWGFMVDMGATTFWEMWSGRGGRLTRSHCHGWSAAPTFFLSTYVLGVKPLTPGFSGALIEPHPGDLTWCRGTVPTPFGDIAVQWENEPDEAFVLRLSIPDGIKADVKLPREGTISINGKTVQ